MQQAQCPAPGAPLGKEAERGLAPTVAVLVVSLVVAAVGVYELCGFGLHSLAQHPHLFNDGFATAGVIVATVAAGAAAGNLAWILTAPRRNAALAADRGRHGHGCADRGPTSPGSGGQDPSGHGSGHPQDPPPQSTGDDSAGDADGAAPPVHHPGTGE
ncbi:hypothetical protein [Streptomyces sp. NPDC056160]|uniref:hypothetical protein n=1 Tax=Streptomyces sp. NPDC056160 TaxID=3345731 RepID=UPI0035D891C7